MKLFVDGRRRRHDDAVTCAKVSTSNWAPWRRINGSLNSPTRIKKVIRVYQPQRYMWVHTDSCTSQRYKEATSREKKSKFACCPTEVEQIGSYWRHFQVSLKEDWAVLSRRHSTVSKFLSLSQYGHDGREGHGQSRSSCYLFRVRVWG